MKNYLAIIRKSDFLDLYNFGYLFIDTGSVVEFDGNVMELPKNPAVRDAVFKRCNRFDYTFTVLLIHFKSDHLEQDGTLYIEDVQNIFALDEEAQRKIKSAFDPKIIINNPLWTSACREVQKRFIYEDAKKGVLNIWKILNIQQPVSDYEEIISDEDIKEIAHEVQNDERPAGALPFWIYLLRYERHAFFPKDDIGFFLDIINIFINTYKEQELDAEEIEITTIYQRLMEFKDKGLHLNELIDKLENTEEGSNFFKKLNDLAKKNSSYNQICTIQIAALFLIFRRMFNEGFNTSENDTLERYSKLFPEAYNFALYLLGIYLGNSHTSNCLYDTMPLPIFKPISRIDESSCTLQQMERCDNGMQGAFMDASCCSDNEAHKPAFLGKGSLHQEINFILVANNKTINRLTPLCLSRSRLPAIISSEFKITDNELKNTCRISTLNHSTNDSNGLLNNNINSSCLDPERSPTVIKILNSQRNQKQREQLQMVLTSEEYQKNKTPEKFCKLLEVQPAWNRAKSLEKVRAELLNPIPKGPLFD